MGVSNVSVQFVTDSAVKLRFASGVPDEGLLFEDQYPASSTSTDKVVAGSFIHMAIDKAERDTG